RPGRAGDQEDVLDPDVDERLDRVIDHRPVVNRQEMLVGDLGQGMKAGPETAREDDALHGALKLTRRRAQANESGGGSACSGTIVPRGSGPARPPPSGVGGIGGPSYNSRVS